MIFCKCNSQLLLVQEKSGEQQQLAFARLLLTQPRYAILDESTSALDVANEKRLYQLLKETGTTFISVGHRPTLVPYHENVLKLVGNGKWQLIPAQDYSSDRIISSHVL